MQQTVIITNQRYYGSNCRKTIHWVQCHIIINVNVNVHRNITPWIKLVKDHRVRTAYNTNSISVSTHSPDP